jgi:hypothetical protein
VLITPFLRNEAFGPAQITSAAFLDAWAALWLADRTDPARNLLPLASSSWPSAAFTVGRSLFEARSTASGLIWTR